MGHRAPALLNRASRASSDRAAATLPPVPTVANCCPAPRSAGRSARTRKQTSRRDGEPAANWTAWGEGAATRFSGAEDSLSLQGDVATATLGVDREGERWMAGVAVAFSEGEGAFAATGDDIAGTNTGTAGGLLETTLTTVYPYARYAINDRLSLWGVLGYGQGELRLIEGRAGTAYDTDIGLRMGALGARGVILDARGFELALRTDAMRVQMHSDSVIGLAGAFAATGRVRALLEGSRMFTLGANRSLEPTLEFGLRHDSGDAETGSGIELGAGIRYADAALGLSLEANARGLVAHRDSAYEEWGRVGGDPPGSGRAGPRPVAVRVAHLGRGLQRPGSALELDQRARLRLKLAGLRPELAGFRRELVAGSGRAAQRGTGLRRRCVPGQGYGNLFLRARACRQRFPEMEPGQALGTRFAVANERGRRAVRART